MEAEKGVKIQILSRKTIKPSSPTPDSKRVHKLSLIDQTYSSTYGSLIFFYSRTLKSPKPNTHFAELAKSLSQTLTHFYPFAGRLTGNVSIDCNDDGAHLFEAEVNADLVDFLRRPDPRLIKALLPVPDPTSALLLVQLTAFSCGATAVGVSFIHKLGDGGSLSYFIRSWTSLSASGDRFPPPEFPGATLFPPPETPIRRTLPLPRGRASATRRFVFSASDLAKLKARATHGGGGGQSPTGVEAVTALLFRSAAGEEGGVIRQHVDLRKRMSPPLPENTVGNILWSFLAFFRGGETDLGEIAAATRAALEEFVREKVDRMESAVREFIGVEAELDKRGLDICCFTSVGKVAGAYEIDFGMGKPVWVTSPIFNDNMFVLIRTRCGQGIEVWVTLEEQKMARFEANEELLEFASVNPSALDYYCRL